MHHSSIVVRNENMYFFLFGGERMSINFFLIKTFFSGNGRVQAKDFLSPMHDSNTVVLHNFI